MSRLLDRLRDELVTEGRIRPVVDVLAPALSSGSGPAPGPAPGNLTIPHEEWTPPPPQLVRTAKDNRRRRFTGAEDHAHDLASDGCSCSKTTMCAFHAHLVDRRWHVRPG